MDRLDSVQEFALQYVFTPRINSSLKAWSTSRSPLQMWVTGQLQNPVGVDLSPELQQYGVCNNDIKEEAIDIPQVTVQGSDNSLPEFAFVLLKQEINPLRHSYQNGIDIYLDVIQFISNYTT